MDEVVKYQELIEARFEELLTCFYNGREVVLEGEIHHYELMEDWAEFLTRKGIEKERHEQLIKWFESVLNKSKEMAAEEKEQEKEKVALIEQIGAANAIKQEQKQRQGFFIVYER